MLLLHSAPPGDKRIEDVKSWFEEIVPIIAGNLRDLEIKGKLNEFAKWTWFAKRFRASLEQLGSEVLDQFGISLDAIPWP
jgi:hypothetical protein